MSDSQRNMNLSLAVEIQSSNLQQFYLKLIRLLGLFSDLRVFVVLGCAPAETGTLGIPMRTLETEVKPGMTQDHLTSQSFKPFKSGSDFFFFEVQT